VGVIRASIAGVQVGDEYPVRIMAVINVSPESFYRGSIVVDPEAVAARAEELERAGADFIDVGGRSTAPYKDTYVPEDVEARRVVEAIRSIKENSKVRIPVSVDTTRARVAEEAIEAGADIVNDVYGLKGDPRMPRVVAEYSVPVIVAAHSRELPERASPIPVVLGALAESLRIAEAAGIDISKVVVDPAIGFFRPKSPPWYEWDSTILANLEILRCLGRPILVGVSRKSFIGAITGREDPAERLWGSLAATAIAVYNGAHIVRTHDPAETRDAVRVAEFIARMRLGR